MTDCRGCWDHRDYPEAGTQVPAGGLEPGESIEQAVRREVREEAGLSQLTLHGSLGVQQHPHPETGQPRVTIFYHASAACPLAGWTHRVPGGTGDDAGMTFQCRFAPLDQVAGTLADQQDEFLDKLPRR